MDAFEQIVSRIYECRGYWTRIGYTVELTKEEKASVGKKSLPRPQIDVIAYSPRKRELLVIECKSFLDSRGVMFEGFHGREDAEKDVYKMFNRLRLREVVLDALVRQLRADGLITGTTPSTKLVLVAGKVYRDDEERLRSLFQSKGWHFVGPREVVSSLREFSSRGYENDAVTFVVKLLERNRIQ